MQFTSKFLKWLKYFADVNFTDGSNVSIKIYKM